MIKGFHFWDTLGGRGKHPQNDGKGVEDLVLDCKTFARLLRKCLRTHAATLYGVS